MRNVLKNFSKPNKSALILEIEGLRFLAIFPVFIFHSLSAIIRACDLDFQEVLNSLGERSDFLSIPWVIVRLDVGVKLFFALSGFVLALPFVLKSQKKETFKFSYRKYMFKRLKRLELPYLLSLIVFGVGQYTIGLLDGETFFTSFWYGVFYCHNLILGYYNPINPVSWSLEIEFQFYLILPLILMILQKLKGLRLTIISILLCLFFLFIKTNPIFRVIDDSILGYGLNFLAGIFAARYYSIKEGSFTPNAIYDFIFIAFLIAALNFYKPQVYFLNILVLNFSLFGMIVCVFSMKYLRQFLCNEIITSIGGMCYSIYLFHYGILHVVTGMTTVLWLENAPLSLNLGIQLIFNTVLVMPILGLIFRFIEKPLIRKKREYNFKQ